MVTFKTFKNAARARKYAGDRPMLAVDKLYLVPETTDLINIQLCQVCLIEASGGIVGSVTLNHLNRLGNANHATPSPTSRNKRIF